MITSQVLPDFPEGARVRTPYGEGVVAKVALMQRAYSVDTQARSRDGAGWIKRRIVFQFGDPRVTLVSNAEIEETRAT